MPVSLHCSVPGVSMGQGAGSMEWESVRGRANGTGDSRRFVLRAVQAVEL